MTWFAFQSRIDENALQLRIDESAIKIRLLHIYYICIRDIIIGPKQCPCSYSFLPAVSTCIFFNITDIKKGEKIEIFITKGLVHMI